MKYMVVFEDGDAREIEVLPRSLKDVAPYEIYDDNCEKVMAIIRLPEGL